ncbi:MAG TPA: 5-oxoprolinase subunit PxpB [Bryobacteraceae bacterium]|jgi:KipI family sensor histidine kinase inhibitor|nr:5-oxoprolinase subunit PxpB [Bryobacteraceae bacterium]
MTIRPASDRSLHVSFGDRIDAASYAAVARLTHGLLGAREVLNLHPAYASVLIDFDPRRYTHERIEALVHACLAGPPPAGQEPRHVEIAVKFGGESGPDLEDVARHTGLSPEGVIERFTAAVYEVYFVGFSTCFPYLGGLPAELATPRLSAPRKHVPEGSVAIGGPQAGVYPLASPGGWRLIGHTPLRLFDPQSVPPPLLRMGDRVRFVAEASR